jgi:GWxTD domain-containing protein
MARAIDSVRATLVELPFDVAGETDYLRAVTLAREAYRIAPDSLRAYRFLTMLAVARNNWADLATIARDRLRRDATDAWASMALALARYRLEPRREMAATFDSALMKLEPRERTRLDRFERIMRPTDVPSSLRLDTAVKARNTKAAWLLAQPLWSSPAADPRTEFLARVTYAELRWTTPNGSIRGADTDRGDIFIRYGPPNRKLGFQVEPTDSSPGEHRVGAVMYEFWVYNADLAFAFYKPLHSGTAAFPGADIPTIEAAKQWQPARWDNIATSRIDSMPTQLARFRSGEDSVDIFLSTRAPMEAIALTGLANAMPTAHLWLYGLDTPFAVVDSTTLGASGRTQWTRRLPAGSYYYRVESIIPGTVVAGRAAAGMAMGHDPATGFAMRGFGISDLLVASRTNAPATAKRWTDFDPEPILGAVAKGSEIALVWENYELGDSGGTSRYEISVVIDRVRSRSGRIAAEIIGRTASVIGKDASDDRLALTFDRTVAQGNTIADNLTIGLGTTPPGSYLLTLRITDRVSGRVATRTVGLTIVE